MDRFLKLALTVVILLNSAMLYAQGGTFSVKGRVLDSGNEPLIGATVLEANSYNGVITDVNGDFMLNVSSENSIIEISFLGYKSKQLIASSTNFSAPIVLETDALTLDDVVVIGYGTIKKSDLSGSIVAIKAEDMNRGAVTTPQELLQGKVPGLSVVSGDGAPGSSPIVRIRSGASLNASNDPLIVIDGVPTSNDAAPGAPNALSTINPNDIETFTVLKDASATAIYGSRASNGVIIITTKKGTSDKISVAYNSTYALKDTYNQVDVASSQQYIDMVSSQYAEGTDQGDAVRKLMNLYPGESTNWQDQIYQTGLSTDQNVSVAGKIGFLPFRASLGYNDEIGTIKTSHYKRYTGSINLSPQFFDKHLSVNINAKGTINDNIYADGGAVGSAIYYDPTKPIYADGDYGYNGYFNWSSVVDGVSNANTLASANPMSLLYDRTNSGRTKRVLGSAQIDYKIHGFEDLRANLNLGYDASSSNGTDFVNSGSFQSAKDSEFQNLGRGSSWDNKRENKLLDFYLNYTKNIEAIDSHIDVMGGYSWQHFYYSNHSLGQSNQTSDLGSKKGWSYNNDTQRYTLDDSRVMPYENYLVSFFGRVNFNIKDRYLLTATVRKDGSSRFDENNRWGLFPSAALAWNIANEDFMSDFTRSVSTLKLRVGYGVTGQQEIQDYLYLPTYVFSNNANSNYLGSSFLKPDGYSPDLKWEETETYNIGIDYGFLRNRITGSIEYYQKYTKDLLNTVSTPAGTNFTNQILANVGTMKNEGVEFSINAVAIQTENFSWSVGYNVTWNTSKITKLTANFNPDYEGIVAANAPFGTGVVLSRHQVGYTPYNYWLFQQVYDTEGNPIQNTLVDRNDDGQITADDRYFTEKSPLADYYMGFSSQFKYKNWDLGFNLRASIGNYAFNASNADNGSLNNFGNQGSLNNYNMAAVEYTRFTGNSTVEQKSSDLFLEDASFLKMDNLTFGYTFDKIFTDKISGRLSLSVQNVFTVTKYSGLDPEIPNVNGIDYSIWPRPRTYSLGISLNF